MSWLVALSERARQAQAVEALSKREFHTYNPQFKSKIIRRGRSVSVLRPLFGRYFFVHMHENWPHIFGAKGVASVLTDANEHPLMVHDAVITEIKHREVNGTIALDDRDSRFWRGQSVTPKSGYLSGFEGRFDKTTQRHREVALFNFLGVETPVEFAPGVLVAAYGRSRTARIETIRNTARRGKRSGKKHRHSSALNCSLT